MDQLVNATQTIAGGQAERRARSLLDAYFKVLGDITSTIQATDGAGQQINKDVAFVQFGDEVERTRRLNTKIMFIGNGGSAAVASHMAADYGKNGGFRATAFNDGAALTCIGNDLGYENVFRKQIEMLAYPKDLLVAISSSGSSANIVAGVDAARRIGCRVITLSGFEPDNQVRRMGDVNFYVQNSEYGFVEISHLAICHAVLDVSMGWPKDSAPDDLAFRRETR